MKYIVDSSAWIEYLNGSSSGEKVNEYIKNDEIYCIAIIISEVISFVKRKGGDVETAYECIIKNAKMIDITPRIAKNAGLLHADMKQKNKDLPFADALIISAAKENKVKIVTKDNHFKTYKEGIII